MSSDPRPHAGREQAQFIFDEWDRRARTVDVTGLLDLYRDDTTLGSPLVPRILDRSSGVLRGKSELSQFFTEGGRRRPNQFVRWHRSGSFLWDGHTLSWEYLRATPEGDQVDISEVMELTDGRIAAHRIYWGWFGTEMLISNAVKHAQTD